MPAKAPPFSGTPCDIFARKGCTRQPNKTYVDVRRFAVARRESLINCLFPLMIVQEYCAAHNIVRHPSSCDRNELHQSARGSCPVAAARLCPAAAPGRSRRSAGADPSRRGNAAHMKAKRLRPLLDSCSSPHVLHISAQAVAAEPPSRVVLQAAAAVPRQSASTAVALRQAAPHNRRRQSAQGKKQLVPRGPNEISDCAMTP